MINEVMTEFSCTCSLKGLLAKVFKAAVDMAKEQKQLMALNLAESKHKAQLVPCIKLLMLHYLPFTF